MRFRVLGTVEVAGPDGEPLPLSDRQRAFVAALLARPGEVVSADRLAEYLWGGEQPANPAAALHNLVSRLRRLVGDDDLITRSPGYLLRAAPAETDAARFDQLVAAARRARGAAAVTLLDNALALWRGRAYAEFAESEIARFEAIRLEEARLDAVEARARVLLDSERAAEALPALEAFVSENPLREQARALLMRVLYALGRHADALRGYQIYKKHLADELGLEPSAAMQRLELEILRHEVPVAGPPPLTDMRVRYVTDSGGRTLAYATLGHGPPLVALSAWVSSLDVVASGRDPRSSLLQRLTGRVSLTLYDRYGTGLSRGVVDDFGLEPSVRELAAVVGKIGTPVNIFAMSQAGPVAIAYAASHPEMVERVVFFGTYASGPRVFTRQDLSASLVSVVRAHWGLGSRVFADLYRPGASDGASEHFAKVLRDSADRDVAAGYLEAMYEADVTGLLPRVTAPALVLHYNGDRMVPFAGGRQLAAGLPDVRMIALDGNYHLPDAAGLDRIVQAISEFLDT